MCVGLYALKNSMDYSGNSSVTKKLNWFIYYSNTILYEGSLYESF